MLVVRHHMLRKILAAIGISSPATAAFVPPYSPYVSVAANQIYNLMFCDDTRAFLSSPGQQAAQWQSILAANPPDVPALKALSGNSAEEGRIRYLAFRELRRTGHPVPEKHILGVIVEVPLRGGLDVLAAYAEGGVRYVNQSGKIAVIEGVDSFHRLVADLFAAARLVVNVIGPWLEPRRRPPPTGSIRMTFLVSDGLYFGEGPFSIMQREQLAAPVIQKATELLQAVVAVGEGA